MTNIYRLLLATAICLLSQVAQTHGYGTGQSTAMQLREAGLASNLAWEVVEGLTTEVG